MGKGPFSFRCFVSRRGPKKIIVPPPLPYLPQPSYVVKIVASPNNNNRLITAVNNNALTKTKKKIDNTRLWIRFDR